MADYSVKTEDQYGRQIKPVLFIPRSYQPLTDFFIDLRTYDCKEWYVDLRALMPNDGNDEITVLWMEVSPIRPEPASWNFGIVDQESGRLVAYLRGSTINPAGGQFAISYPVQAAPNMLPVRLDRPRLLVLYIDAPDVNTSYVSAYGDIRLYNRLFKNIATKNAGATFPLGGGKAIISNIAPWDPEDQSTTLTDYTIVGTIDLGAIYSIKKIAAYWSYYIETAQDANAQIGIGYSTDGTLGTYSPIKSFSGNDVPATLANAGWDNRAVENVSARYLHMGAKTGATGNAVHCRVITWFAWVER